MHAIRKTDEVKILINDFFKEFEEERKFTRYFYRQWVANDKFSKYFLFEDIVI